MGLILVDQTFERSLFPQVEGERSARRDDRLRAR